MAVQLSVTARNARLDAIETTAGTSAVLQIRSGTQPADCAAANAGTLLATINLPSDWMNAASSGTKTKLGTWTATASTGGTAGHFRVFNSGATVCHIQGSVTATAGGGDMTLDNTSIASGQTVTVNTFTLTDANA
jgi:hypothetical protein